ncbi:MAG: hypothetical protein COC03_07135 [Robiginitomaculum sp.]|nr:MAG: hypothetical protein COC03_07135 [Robiginitomaculum sp.]
MTEEEEIHAQLKLNIRELVADKNKDSHEILGRPADAAIKEAMLLSRLQSQWLLFGSFASIAFILNAAEDVEQLNGWTIWALLLFSAAALLSWFSISEWANYYYNKSTYYYKYYIS